MFEVGWSEMLLIAIVMIVVVGPKDLPGMLRSIGRTVAKLRSMAGDFQKQFNEALQEAELDDVKKGIDELRGLNPKEQIRKHINPFEKAAADVRAGLNSLNPQPPKPAADAQPAEPLKTGPVENPDLPSTSAAIATPVAESAKPAAKVAKPIAKGSAKSPAKVKATSEQPKKSAKTVK